MTQGTSASKRVYVACGVCGSPTSSRWGFCSRTRECKRQQQAAEYAVNGEAIRARAREWGRQNAAYKSARMAEYYQANRTEKLAKKAEYYWANLEAIRAYHEQNKDRLNKQHREWGNANPDKVLANTRKRRARLMDAYVEDVQPGILITVLGSDCAICGHPLSGELQLDHINPLVRGGLHSYANCQMVHAKCNKSKHARSWADPLADQREAIAVECRKLAALS